MSLPLAGSNSRRKQICFDGALPLSKRSTRLSRIEKSRSHLEACRRQSFAMRKECRREMSSDVISSAIWRSRSLPTRWKNLPENPFMVSAVFEDLIHRWNKTSIQHEFDFELACLPDAEYPWSNITIMVPGEADVGCARVTKMTGAAILTSDSDLLVHDLGLNGSVAFLNTLQLIEESQENSTATELRAQRISPADLCRRLGIPNIQRFAFELSRNPQAPFNELLRLAKEYDEGEESSSEYVEFLREYREDHSLNMKKDVLISRQMDPRVSELFWQYELPDTYSETPPFHVYLGLLHEDHSRRCAWEQARAYRSLGYALLDLSRPENQRSGSIHEFVRRGTRVVAEQVTLPGEKSVMSTLKYLQQRLNIARGVFQGYSLSDFWFLFAFSEVYEEISSTATIPSAKKLESFLGKGYMGNSGADWADIHLLAQVQAVLYSLRMLQQFILITAATYDIGLYRNMLEDLPPLYLLMRPRGEIIGGFSEKETCRRAVQQLVQNYG